MHLDKFARLVNVDVKHLGRVLRVVSKRNLDLHMDIPLNVVHQEACRDGVDYAHDFDAQSTGSSRRRKGASNWCLVEYYLPEGDYGSRRPYATGPRGGRKVPRQFRCGWGKVFGVGEGAVRIDHDEMHSGDVGGVYVLDSQTIEPLEDYPYL